jgi:hypothetical protein
MIELVRVESSKPTLLDKGKHMKKPLARATRIAEITSLKHLIEQISSAMGHKRTTVSLRLNSYSNFLNFLLENEDSLMELEFEQLYFTGIERGHTLH